MRAVREVAPQHEPHECDSGERLGGDDQPRDRRGRHDVAEPDRRDGDHAQVQRVDEHLEERCEVDRQGRVRLSMKEVSAE